MRILSDADIKELAPKGAVLTIGNFDGVHRGHQAILRTARQAADRLGVPLAVMTFDPHPAAVLHPEKSPGVLTPLPLKAFLLEQCGADVLIVIRDTLSLLNQSPKEFVSRFLVPSFAPRAIVEGPNFTFGYGRSGTLQTLREFGLESGFDVLEVPYTTVHLNQDQRSVTCSSSTVRRLLEDGKAAHAAQILSRPYRLVGTTIPGRGIGRTLGFPTANLKPAEQIIPSEGVYAGFVAVGDSLEEVCRQPARRPAAFSIGRAKTFVTDHPLLLEAHLLESNVEDLSRKYLAMDFVEWLRNQQRFESREDLIRQIALDCQKARQILSDSAGR
ncbi:MAG TPA: bifunctional riboflavin kinase/FAD synthetase [Anaerohalosphaeraceae bacterium]|nr:bifunctional riboflavin kinase/FAD synthetase [Anaerohalosphaeraceae bacterium]